MQKLQGFPNWGSRTPGGLSVDESLNCIIKLNFKNENNQDKTLTKKYLIFCYTWVKGVK